MRYNKFHLRVTKPHIYMVFPLCEFKKSSCLCKLDALSTIEGKKHITSLENKCLMIYLQIQTFFINYCMSEESSYFIGFSTLF